MDMLDASSCRLRRALGFVTSLHENESVEEPREWA